MSYLSIEFALSFLLLFTLYWSLPNARWQNALLTLASYGLLSCFSVNFALQLMIYAVVIYGLSWLMTRYAHPRRWLFVSIGVAIINLFIFKYFDFFREYLQALLDFMDADYLLPATEILLPIGISYYTFHSITYLVSLYKEEIELPSFFDVILFLGFFPTLVAGPINRARTMLPQIQADERTMGDLNRILLLIILAIAKKLWLASYLSASFVEPILNNPNEYHSAMILAGIYAYALQIFLDFSGYTDLMIALALLLGFDIPKNFDRPYAAINMRDFWQRWHISLSHWIRDYLYIPLGGNRHGFTRTQINLMIAMVLSGLWHGAGLHFIVWGALHGAAIVFLNLGNRWLGKEKIYDSSPYVARWLTFHFVCLTWVYFYAPSVGDAQTILQYLFSNTHAGVLSQQALALLAAVTLLLAIYPYADRAVEAAYALLKRLPLLLKPFALAILITAIVALSPEGIPAFIYANF